MSHVPFENEKNANDISRRKFLASTVGLATAPTDQSLPQFQIIPTVGRFNSNPNEKDPMYARHHHSKKRS
jgi:hypothetical protein